MVTSSNSVWLYPTLRPFTLLLAGGSEVNDLCSISRRASVLNEEKGVFVVVVVVQEVC